MSGGTYSTRVCPELEACQGGLRPPDVHPTGPCIRMGEEIRKTFVSFAALRLIKRAEICSQAPPSPFCFWGSIGARRHGARRQDINQHGHAHRRHDLLQIFAAAFCHQPVQSVAGAI